MDFHQALLRRYVKPQHLWGGGGIGGAISGAAGSLGDVGAAGSLISGAAGGIGGALAGAGGSISGLWHDVLRPNKFTPNVPMNTFDPTVPVNSFSANMPTNSFQASAPSIDAMNFQPAQDAGIGAFNSGAADLGSTFGSQQALAQQAGQTLGAQQNLYGQQQGLADALLAQSQGKGPNPAQQMFQNNNNQAIQQQASAIASARGINPAMAARLASQQGGAMQQGAAGQAALLQAQQQIGAQQALGGQQQAMGQNLLSQNATLAGQGNLYKQAAGTAANLGSLGGSMYGMGIQGQQAQNALQSNNALAAQNTNASVAAQNANLGAEGQQLDAGVAAQNANLAMQGQGMKANAAQQNADLQMQGEGLKAGVATGNAKNYSNVVGGVAGSLGASAMQKAMAPSAPAASQGTGAIAGPDMATDASVATVAHGGQIHDQQAMSMADALMRLGGRVPGKAKKKGDAAANDTVPAVLSPNEIVLPRSVAMAEDAPEKAAEFVAKLKEKSGKSSGAKGYGKILEKHREVQKHMAALDELIRRQAS